MLFPMMFFCPPAYWALRQAAEMRHMMCGMPPQMHYPLMRAFYGF